MSENGRICKVSWKKLAHSALLCGLGGASVSIGSGDSVWATELLNVTSLSHNPVYLKSLSWGGKDFLFSVIILICGWGRVICTNGGMYGLLKGLPTLGPQMFLDQNIQKPSPLAVLAKISGNCVPWTYSMGTQSWEPLIYCKYCRAYQQVAAPAVYLFPPKGIPHKDCLSLFRTSLYKHRQLLGGWMMRNHWKEKLILCKIIIIIILWHC